MGDHEAKARNVQQGAHRPGRVRAVRCAGASHTGCRSPATAAPLLLHGQLAPCCCSPAARLHPAAAHLLVPVHTTRPLSCMSWSRVRWLVRSSIASTVAVTSSGGRVEGSPSSLRRGRGGWAGWGQRRDGARAAGVHVVAAASSSGCRSDEDSARGHPPEGRHQNADSSYVHSFIESVFYSSIVL